MRFVYDFKVMCFTWRDESLFPPTLSTSWMILINFENKKNSECEA